VYITWTATYDTPTNVCDNVVACFQVGHTIQDKGINGACGGRVLRVDVGLSAGCGNGEVQVRLQLAGWQPTS
jgi:hypothetical protein